MDIEPVNDWLCTLTLNHTNPITLIAVYAPQAFRSEEEKEQAYKDLNSHPRKHKRNGPVYISGDMNARVQKKVSSEEAHIVENHTVELHTADPMQGNDQVIQNRQLLLDFCDRNKLKLTSTYFQKQNNKLVTYREIGVDRLHDITRGTHEQIDFIISQES